MDGCFVAGADPELMLISPAGEWVSAIPLIAGTKKEPQPVRGGAIQHDNVLAEFNVTPSGSSEEFVHNISTVLQELASVVRPNRLTVQAYAAFPESELEHEEARIFGCDPDFCAWPNKEGFLAMNSIPTHKALEPWRSAGGHLHIGHKESTRAMLEDDYGKIEVVKALDIFQGIPSVLLDPDQSARERRTLYGAAGAHRPKPYGVEYRALGNFWMRSPDLVQLIYELAHRAVELTLQGETAKIIEQIGQKNIQDIINHSRPRKAKRVVTEVLRPYLTREQFERLRRNSPRTAVRDQDLYQTWGIPV